jgi:hypothetical protein
MDPTLVQAPMVRRNSIIWTKDSAGNAPGGPVTCADRPLGPLHVAVDLNVGHSEPECGWQLSAYPWRCRAQDGSRGRRAKEVL